MSDILTLKDDEQGRQELGRIVAELTQEKPWKHSFDATMLKRYTEGVDYCRKCHEYHSINGHAPCPVPDPIDVTDMGLAVKMFREADIQPVGLREYIQQTLSRKSFDGNLSDFILRKASAFEIFKIIALAKGNQ
jgi:hypothetical protein